MQTHIVKPCVLWLRYRMVCEDSRIPGYRYELCILRGTELCLAVVARGSWRVARSSWHTAAQSNALTNQRMTFTYLWGLTWRNCKKALWFRFDSHFTNFGRILPLISLINDAMQEQTTLIPTICNDEFVVFTKHYQNLTLTEITIQGASCIRIKI